MANTTLIQNAPNSVQVIASIHYLHIIVTINLTCWSAAGFSLPAELAGWAFNECLWTLTALGLLHPVRQKTQKGDVLESALLRPLRE